jgi:hypothetical protein
MYTLIGTAKLNDIDPKAYLRYVLTRITDHLIDRIGRTAAVERRRSALPKRRLTFEFQQPHLGPAQ